MSATSSPALIVLALLVVVTIWPAARLVDSGIVGRGPVRETVDAEGRTRLHDRYVIAAPMAAMARRLQLEPGDAIKSGQILVVLDPVTAPALDARSRAEARASLAAARARLGAAREEAKAATAVAQQLRAEAERQRASSSTIWFRSRRPNAPRPRSLRGEREAASARFREATAMHEVQAAQAILARDSGEQPYEAALELRAPVAGIVLRRHYESARPVQVGEPLIEIGDPATMEVEVDVLSADAVRLREGMRVELLRWGEPRPLLGTGPPRRTGRLYQVLRARRGGTAGVGAGRVHQPA